MVSKVHPSTLKAAEAKGFGITGADADTAYTVTWAEGKKKLLAADAKAGVADMALWKMLTLEYPKVKAVQIKEDLTWSLKQGKRVLAEGFASLTEAWDAHLDQEAEASKAKQAAAGDAPADDGSKSIVKRKYRDAYRPNNHSTGDEVAVKLKEYSTGPDGRLDRPKLERFAKKNDLWDDKYAALNNGQVRMNVGNRLRKKVNSGEFTPQWVK